MEIIHNTNQSNSFCTKLLLCIAMFIFIQVQICNAAQFMCNGVNYTSASKFGRNLNTVLNNLVDHTSSSGGFNASVSGLSPDIAYGMLQCRGDATVEECYNCSQEAKIGIRQVCVNNTGGRYWLDKCFIRYENYNFIGAVAIDGHYVRNGANASDPDVFSTAVKELFRNLTTEAYGSASRYSSGTTIDNSFHKIFGLVQCWRDITLLGDCQTCLSEAVTTTLRHTFDANSLGGVSYLGSCISRYETYAFFNPAPPPPPFQSPDPPAVQEAPSSLPLQKNSSNTKAIIFGILGGLLFMVLIWLFALRRKTKSTLFARTNLHGEYNEDMEEDSATGEQIIFDMEKLTAATRNFHDDNKIGEGGFGPVYKGTMPNGKEIAVKRLSKKSVQGKREFLNEVKLVAKIQHRNLVNLLGCCTEGSDRFLIYEFLANNSLDKILFHPERRKELDWPKRLNIILGVARGLLYLHEDSQLRIIHRDIKASNILLDEKMNPKISDFGLARLFPRDETHVNTRVAGTYGYMAPEYAMQGQLSAKADVYSFGVVLLEIVCGRKNSNPKLTHEFQSLLDLVWKSYSKGNVVDVIDRTIIESCPHHQVSACIQVGLLCIQQDPSLRPPMSSVYRMLSDPSTTNLIDPKKPAFMGIMDKLSQVYDISTSTISTGASSSSASSTTLMVRPSINDATITDLESR